MQLYQRCLAGQQCSHRQGSGVKATGPTNVSLSPKCVARGRGRCMQIRATAATEELELTDEKRDIQKILSRPYKYGFQTLIESDTFPKGLDEDVVRAISAKKKEPEWMLEFRLKAYRQGAGCFMEPKLFE